jgi:hypothetical protein
VTKTPLERLPHEQPSKNNAIRDNISTPAKRCLKTGANFLIKAPV